MKRKIFKFSIVKVIPCKNRVLLFKEAAFLCTFEFFRAVKFFSSENKFSISEKKLFERRSIGGNKNKLQKKKSSLLVKL